jgi:hypothetical protein
MSPELNRDQRMTLRTKLFPPAGLLLIVLLLSACGESKKQASSPALIANLDGLEPGWNVIEPGGDTMCSDGSPYRFFVRPGASDRLMVFFQGGGACWNGGMCDPDLEPTYRINLQEVDPNQYHGIFLAGNSNNPLGNHSIVFAPYCSADVHIGNAIATYEAPEMEQHDSHPVRIQHRGFVNADAVLDWTYAHFFSPTRIFVTGSSAGSIPSPYYAMLISERYPEASISQLGDGSGGYRLNGQELRPQDNWGTLGRLRELPELESLPSENFDYETLYITAAGRSPEIMFAQYDSAEDVTQKKFLAAGGAEPVSLLSNILANQADIRSEVSNFRSYIAGGDVHTILGRPEFYTYQVNGISLRDWVADLVNGKAISDVHCSDCSEPEVSAGGISAY